MEPLFAQVIVTSWLYPDGNFDIDRLRRLSGLVGKDRLVLDLRYHSLYTAVEVQVGANGGCLGGFLMVFLTV
jgi:hypothetical protein